MKKLIVAAIAASTLSGVFGQEIRQSYAAVCLDGKIAARPKGAIGPVRTLWLLLGGVRHAPCEEAVPLTLDQLAEPATGKRGEGLFFPGLVTFEVTRNGRPIKTMIGGTFQENKVSRDRAGQSI